MKKMKKTLCGFLVCLLLVAITPLLANAAVKAPVCPKTQTLYFERSAPFKGVNDTSVYGFIYIKNLSSTATITNIKSSNTYYTANKRQGLNAIQIGTSTKFHIKGHNVKVGEKSTFSFVVNQNGQSYKLSCKVTFKQHPAVFKSFKIGSKDYASEINGYWQYGAKISRSGKTQIKVAAAKNYKIDFIEIAYKKGNKTFTKKIKNGQKVSLKNAISIDVTYHTTKKPKYYKAPGSDYRYYYIGQPTPLYSDFSFNLW